MILVGYGELIGVKWVTLFKGKIEQWGLKRWYRQKFWLYEIFKLFYSYVKINDL
jgi:hypothetical protein